MLNAEHIHSHEAESQSRREGSRSEIDVLGRRGAREGPAVTAATAAADDDEHDREEALRLDSAAAAAIA